MAVKNRLREKQLLIRLTEQEYENILLKSKYCNLTMSAYVRKMSVDGVIIKRDFTAIKEVNKIGVNINQIAHKVNERDILIANDIADLQFQFEKLFEVVYADILDG
ncbi:MAG: plasmid mobilization relaxosome protein MobC [Oscillospiraceae bacterium]